MPSRATEAGRHSLRVRMVDAVQFDRRRKTYDFDMIPYRWDHRCRPATSRRSTGARRPPTTGTRNYMGVKSPAVDAMIAACWRHTSARNSSPPCARSTAADSGFYVVPLFHLPEQWVARWSASSIPATTSLFGYLPETWWRIPVILGDQTAPHSLMSLAGTSTLDDLFRNAAMRRPDAMALCDPLNRRTSSPTANHAASPMRRPTMWFRRLPAACAGSVLLTGLPWSALQLSNTVESVLGLLGVLRAGLIAAPLPMLWRRADAAAALNRVGAKAIVIFVADRHRRPLRDHAMRRRRRGVSDPIRLQLRRWPSPMV